MAYLIPIVLILATIQLILDKKIRVKVDYGGSISETNGFKLYALTMAILFIVIIVCFFFIDGIHPLIGIFLMGLFFVRAAFEWIYIRNTKRHYVSLIMLTLSLAITVLFYIIWKL